MALEENTDHSISLNDAARMTASYRQSATTGSIIAGAFGKNSLLKILDQEGCVGIRMYFALTGDEEMGLVLTGVKASGDDMYEGELAQHIHPCPPFCSSNNPLNS